MHANVWFTINKLFEFELNDNFEMLMLKELWLVHKNTLFNQNNRIKEQVFRISQICIWVLDSYDTLIVYLSCKIARWS
jgi:hypothetical protein